MCGRFVQVSDRALLQGLFGFDDVDVDSAPSYNVAPTQAILAVVERDGHRTLRRFKWGLVPSWAQDASMGSRMINARAETVTEKPSFRNAFRSRRCLVPADGFYEWKRDGEVKTPYFIHRTDGCPFAFAGLWERNDKFEEPLETCTLITTEGSAVMEGIHDRMPLVLPEEEYDVWLNPTADPEHLHSLLRSYSGTDLAAYPVSRRVNSARNDGPDLIEPVAGE